MRPQSLLYFAHMTTYKPASQKQEEDEERSEKKERKKRENIRNETWSVCLRFFDMNSI